jgi:hypothetical protein
MEPLDREGRYKAWFDFRRSYGARLKELGLRSDHIELRVEQFATLLEVEMRRLERAKQIAATQPIRQRHA